LTGTVTQQNDGIIKHETIRIYGVLFQACFMCACFDTAHIKFIFFLQAVEISMALIAPDRNTGLTGGKNTTDKTTFIALAVSEEYFFGIERLISKSRWALAFL
jgi:hypothetical protein